MIVLYDYFSFFFHKHNILIIVFLIGKMGEKTWPNSIVCFMLTNNNNNIQPTVRQLEFQRKNVFS